MFLFLEMILSVAFAVSFPFAVLCVAATLLPTLPLHHNKTISVALAIVLVGAFYVIIAVGYHDLLGYYTL